MSGGSSLKPAANIKTKEYNNAYGQKQKQKPQYVHQTKSFEGKQISNLGLIILVDNNLLLKFKNFALKGFWGSVKS